MNSETKVCQNCKKQFTIEPEDFNFYEKLKVPPPTFCPQCRMMRRFSFRNARHLFRRPDSHTGNEIFSIFPKDAPAKVYALDFWNSDKWDPMEYGRDYDSSRPFFEQFRELLYEVPWPARSVINSVNSDYSDNFTDAKNSYLCFNGTDIENSAYVVNFFTVKEGFDLMDARHTELSYDNYMADESYRVFFSINAEDCHDVWFSRNMMGCNNCFGCVNLRNKSYHIFNKSYTKEAYKEYMGNLDLGSYKTIAELKKKTREFWAQHPMRFSLAINTTNSTGEHIEHTKNVKLSYNIHEAENIRYAQFLAAVKDSYDYSSWGESSQMYECTTCGDQCDSLKMCWECWPSSRALEYSAFCRSSSDLFGCVSLKKKQYCILNKQYSKEGYEKLREKIIAHMNEMPYTGKEGRVYAYGEFFPQEFSPYAYNETIAQDYFPLSEAEAIKKGAPWRPSDRREYETTKDATSLPDHIKGVGEDIVKEVIRCSACGRAYRIIQLELAFLKRVNLPLPRLCVECRYAERSRFVNSPEFRHGACQCAGIKDESGVYQNAIPHTHHGEEHCPNEFETAYPSDTTSILYCEKCYQAESV